MKLIKVATMITVFYLMSSFCMVAYAHQGESYTIAFTNETGFDLTPVLSSNNGNPNSNDSGGNAENFYLQDTDVFDRQGYAQVHEVTVKNHSGVALDQYAFVHFDYHYKDENGVTKTGIAATCKVQYTQNDNLELEYCERVMNPEYIQPTPGGHGNKHIYRFSL